MIFHEINQKIQKHFDDNLKDWFEGGPKETGWTRTGPSISPQKLKLISYYFAKMPITEILAKNREETQKWHIDCLKNKKEAYIEEYLLPRYGNLARLEYFTKLFHSVKSGLIRPAYVADIEQLNLGFKYFRFDGCHRACILSYLGYTDMPVICFKTVLEPFAF